MNDRLKYGPQERLKILESKVLAGQDVARIVLELQDLFDQSIGIRLLEPNAVLAIAGLKGNADIHGVVLDEESNQALIKANEQSENRYGIRLKVPGRQDLVKERKEY